MKEGLYLSDVLDPSYFRLGAFNIIVAPCGSGKTTAAINTIAPLASSPRKALYLIDTQNGNARLAQNEALTRPYVWFEQYAGNAPFWGEELPNKTVVSTYAQFGAWVSRKRKLRLYFSIKDKKGHYISYDKQWSRIKASGYDISFGRTNNRHYVIIRKL